MPALKEALMQEFPPFRLDPVNQCLWRRRETADDERLLLPPKAAGRGSAPERTAAAGLILASAAFSRRAASLTDSPSAGSTSSRTISPGWIGGRFTGRFT